MDPAVIAAVIAAVASLAVGLINRKQSKAINEVKHQVQNSHDSNLRDDLDRVLAGLASVLDGQKRHDGEIAGIREDQRIHRLEHLAPKP